MAIDGFPGSDRLFGGNGNDEIVGNDGADLLNGGHGADSLVDPFQGIPPDFDRDVVDTFQCGADLDSVVGSSFDNINADCEDVVG